MSIEFHLRVFLDRSELHRADGSIEVFREGAQSQLAVARYRAIAEALEAGFLEQEIEVCLTQPEHLELLNLDTKHEVLLTKIAEAVTSEVGRALLGLSLLQLTVKALEPSQSIRLHKAGSGGSSFGWVDGISMRSLDKSYVTPALRSAGLLRMNADGFMMTRSFAENYPYSGVYKAAIRGARAEWQDLVEALESGELSARSGLRFLLSKLLNEAESFKALADSALEKLELSIVSGEYRSLTAVLRLVERHMDCSSYAARLMEISMHALVQGLQDLHLLADCDVVPLSQMRSANKKHGNIGDVELASDDGIRFAWDAKYGKSYLRDELEELNEKLGSHPSVLEAGFVTSEVLQRGIEHAERMAELSEMHGVHIEIQKLDAWVARRFDQLQGVATEEDLAQAWLRAYVESLCQIRPQLAPIDEPCRTWIETLCVLL